MQFCTKHWSGLKDAIRERGLQQLVASSSEEGFAKQVEQLESSTVTRTTFDPLMGAHYAILGRALEVAGLSLMLQNEDGSDRCPLCYLQAEHDKHCTTEGCGHSFEPWIGYAADDMRKEAVRLGLMAES